MLEISFLSLWFVISSSFWYSETNWTFFITVISFIFTNQSSLIFWTKEVKSDKKINTSDQKFVRIWRRKELLTKPLPSPNDVIHWNGICRSLESLKSPYACQSQSPETLFASSKRCFGLVVSKQKWLQMKILALALPQQRLFNTTPSSIGKERRFGQFPRDYVAQHKTKGKNGNEAGSRNTH